MDHNTRHDEDNDNNDPAEWSFIDDDSSDDEWDNDDCWYMFLVCRYTCQ